MKSESLPFFPSDCFLSRENESQAVIDLLLHGASEQEPETVNLLLDLKFALIQRDSPEELLLLFFNLRGELEDTHYLPVYRLRRFLEHSIRVTVSSTRGYPESTSHLKLSGIKNLSELETRCLQEAGTRMEVIQNPLLRPQVHFMWSKD